MNKVKIIIICLIALVVAQGLGAVIIKNINTEENQTLDSTITDEQGKEAKLNFEEIDDEDEKYNVLKPRL